MTLNQAQATAVHRRVREVVHGASKLPRLEDSPIWTPSDRHQAIGITEGREIASSFGLRFLASIGFIFLSRFAFFLCPRCRLE